MCQLAEDENRVNMIRQYNLIPEGLGKLQVKINCFEEENIFIIKKSGMFTAYTFSQQKRHDYHVL